ncbi:MAG: replicative DNA helicase [Bacteroidetes bacterium]|nr:MAG: replicative DNA helicase [Bacteroidota bacterium]
METTNSTQRKTFKPKATSLLDGLGKVPPQALDLEEAVLGALLIDKECLSKVSDFLRVEAFYSEKNQFIYQAILSLFSKSEPIDIRTVVNELRLSGKLEIVGGPFYVSELTFKIQSSANIEYHARILVQYSLKRTLIGVSSEIQRDSFDDTRDVFQILDHAQQQLFEVSEQMQKKNFMPVEGLVQLALKEIEEKRKHTDGLTGVPSGFLALDRLTSGWQKSDLVIIAARPAMGKTAFVLSTIRNAAVDHGKSCAIFSLEMSNVQLMLRLISSEAEIESEKIKKGRLEDHEWIQLGKKASNLAKSKIFIDDTPALSVLELRSKCRRLKSQHNIELIVIDYMQLMSGDTGSKNGGNREQEIAYISRSLKGLAKELDVPVIALSQLSRATETRGGSKIPMLSDLRESGSIEQDADIVMFIHRPEYYGLTEDEEGMPTAGVGNIIVAKHRNGPVDTVKLRYIGKFTKFCDFEENGFSGGGFSEIGSMGFPDVKGVGFSQNEVRIPSKNWDNNDKNKNIDLGKASDYDNTPPPF